MVTTVVWLPFWCIYARQVVFKAYCNPSANEFLSKRYKYVIFFIECQDLLHVFIEMWCKHPVVMWEDTMLVGSLLPIGLGPISNRCTHIRIGVTNSKISVRLKIT